MCPLGGRGQSKPQESWIAILDGTQEHGVLGVPNFVYYSRRFWLSEIKRSA